MEIGSILSGIAAIGMALIGYLWHQRDAAQQRQHSALEKRVNDNADNIVQLRTELDESEKEVWKRLSNLPQDFVPRPEMQAIIDGIRSDSKDTKEMLKEIRQLLLKKQGTLG